MTTDRIDTLADWHRSWLPRAAACVAAATAGPCAEAEPLQSLSGG